MNRPSVTYWNTIPSPYVIQRFNRLIERSNVNLRVWFTRSRDSDRSWDVNPDEWSFPYAFNGSENTITKQIIGELSTSPPDLFVSPYHAPAYALGSAAAKAVGSRTAFRVVPTFDAWQPRSHYREFAKHALFRSVDSVKVPGPNGADYARRYGTPENRIFPVTQSIHVELYASARNISPETRATLRQMRGLTGTVFIYVGRLWLGKGIDTLIEAYRLTVSSCPDVSLLLVGDGVDEAAIRSQAASLPNIVFTGFVQPREIPHCHAMADVFVFPTLGDPHGLAIDEAMAASLPVISSAAAGDVRLRLPPEAGRIVPPGDSAALAEAMIELASATPEHRRSMGDAGHSLASLRSHDRYAEDFESFVERTLSLPQRRSIAAKSTYILGHGLRVTSKVRSRGPVLTT